MDVKCLYTSASVNRSPHCLAWNPTDDVIIFGSCNSVVVANHNLGCVKIHQTLVEHSDRVNCVRWINSNYFISTSTDKTARFWKRDNSDFKCISCLKGHTESVTCSDGILDPENSTFTIVTTSTDSTIKFWKASKDNVDKELQSVQTFPIHRNGFALDLKLTFGPNNLPFLFVSTDSCKILIFSSKNITSDFVQIHSLAGHEDWVQSLTAVKFNSNLLLASGGQDTFVRLWKVCQISKEKALEELKPVKDLGPDDEIRQKEEIFSLDDNFYSVVVESILAGHEDKVYGLKWQWHNKLEDLTLLSCSLDKTMIIWKQDPESGIWLEQIRVGEVGGNTLGFLGCDFSPDRQSILGYNFTGAIHFWKGNNEGNWEPGVPPSGHHGSVEDLDWEREGRYLVSVSVDQTTRVHAPWRREGQQDYWAEVGRPQVHGHDLACLTMLPNHRFASGAEEKIVRVFESTKNFLQNFSALAKVDLSEEIQNKVAQGASVPSLGLSNKAVDDSSTPKVPENDRHVKDQFPDFYFKPESYLQPPSEDSLFQNTLWPELQKLYGHGYEVFCLASDQKGSLIASACKASKAEHAQVLLFDSSTWRLVDKLPGHALTVIQMEFSPCDKYLLTASRDRTWSLFERDEGNKFTRIAYTDKVTSIHQRLLWSCSWSKDCQFFSTASRDKKVAIWSKKQSRDEPTQKTCLGDYGLACHQPFTFTESVTAVAFSPLKTQNGSYLLAAGLESGVVQFITFAPEKSGPEQWQEICSLNRSLSHHKPVKRIRFCPDTSRGLLLSTCSEDHSVKIFDTTNLLS